MDSRPADTKTEEMSDAIADRVRPSLLYIQNIRRDTREVVNADKEPFCAAPKLQGQ